MARFVINTPITTREPTVTVDAGLPVGNHRFRLEVIDAAGLRSRTPGEAIVEIQRIVVDPRPPVGPVIDPRPPVVGPVIDPRPPVIDPTGPIVITRPVVVSPSPRRSRGRPKKEKP